MWENVFLVLVLWHHINCSACVGTFGTLFNIWNYMVWLRITDEGSVTEMRIWSILLIKSESKWCIHLNRGLFLNLTLFRYHISIFDNTFLQRITDEDPTAKTCALPILLIKSDFKTVNKSQMKTYEFLVKYLLLFIFSHGTSSCYFVWDLPHNINFVHCL